MYTSIIPLQVIVSTIQYKLFKFHFVNAPVYQTTVCIEIIIHTLLSFKKLFQEIADHKLCSTNANKPDINKVTTQSLP